MQAVPLGKIAVPTPGTPVRIATVYTPCARIRFESPLSNAHVAWVGTAGLVGSTLTKVIKQLQFPAAGAIADSIEFEAYDGDNELNLADYWLDANTASEGVIVTYWQR
jgi:hypothetical protein